MSEIKLTEQEKKQSTASDVQQKSAHVDMSDIDEDDDYTADNSNPNVTPNRKKKPLNPVMEYYNHDVAMALKIGSTDVAIELVDESAETVFRE